PLESLGGGEQLHGVAGVLGREGLLHLGRSIEANPILAGRQPREAILTIWSRQLALHGGVGAVVLRHFQHGPHVPQARFALVPLSVEVRIQEDRPLDQVVLDRPAEQQSGPLQRERRELRPRRHWSREERWSGVRKQTCFHGGERYR